MITRHTSVDIDVCLTPGELAEEVAKLDAEDLAVFFDGLAGQHDCRPSFINALNKVKDAKYFNPGAKHMMLVIGAKAEHPRG